MDPEYQRLFEEVVRFRIVEKRTSLLESFVKEQCLPPLVSVECRPLIGCELKRCFVNVERQVERAGGSMMTGWIFNEYENRHIEGEAHAVWLSPTGKKLDITPHRFPAKRVLFSVDTRVAKKRGYTAAPKLIISQNPRVVLIEKFDSCLDQLLADRFEAIGKYIDISFNEVRSVAIDLGIPEEVARYMFNSRADYSQRMADKYGHSDAKL